MNLSDLTNKHIDWLKIISTGEYNSCHCIDGIDFPVKCKSCPLQVKFPEHNKQYDDGGGCHRNDIARKAKDILKTHDDYLIDKILLGGDDE